jgi:hypothetical protein
MTNRLREALRSHRHLRGERVLYRADGRSMTESSLKEQLARAARLANLRNTVRTFSATRFARTWRCVGPQRGPSRSWRGIRTSARRNATCT